MAGGAELVEPGIGEQQVETISEPQRLSDRLGAQVESTENDINEPTEEPAGVCHVCGVGPVRSGSMRQPKPVSPYDLCWGADIPSLIGPNGSLPQRVHAARLLATC